MKGENDSIYFAGTTSLFVPVDDPDDILASVESEEAEVGDGGDSDAEGFVKNIFNEVF